VVKEKEEEGYWEKEGKQKASAKGPDFDFI
jgi:hypothetical protein